MHVILGVVLADVQALKAQPGGDMTVGGPQLAAGFMRLGLVDEWRVFVHPVILGRGKRAFEKGEMQGLRL